MAKKRDKTLLIIGGLAVAGLAVYMLTKKSVPTVQPGYGYLPAGAAPPAAGSGSLLSSGASLISSLSSLFGGGGSTPGLAEPYAPVGLAPVAGGTNVSPAAGYSTIDISTMPSLISGAGGAMYR